MEKETKMTNSEIVDIYKQSSDSEKQLLIKIFGEELFNEDDYLKVFENFCCESNVVYRTFIEKYSNLDENGLANEMLKQIIPTVNGGWKPDYSNSNEKKWFPYFEYAVSGFGFSRTYCGYARTYASVGSRLCFKTEQKCISTAKKYIKIYQKLLS